MRKSIKKIAASILAATMVLGSLTIASADEVNFEDADCANGEVYYTLAGGVNDWNPTGKANQMKETIWDGVYSIEISLPAYDGTAEYNSRFKICKIDEITVANGWTGALCLGTTTYDDNQTMFRVENEDAIDNATVYFDVNTGAVVILGNDTVIPYNFSWVGYDGEVQYTTVDKFATCGIVWPEDKLKVDTTPDIKAGYDALVAKVKGVDLADESLYEDSVKYVLAGGCSPLAWGTTSSANEMKETEIAGVYSIKLSVPAFTEDTEWQNRFKILRLDDITCANPWTGSLCVGTTTYDDNQTTFRIENAEAMDVTVYVQPSTGAVVVLDSEGNNVDYKFSWVGYDSEVQYTTVSEFATCGYTWPDDKVKTDVPTDLADKHTALVKLIKEGPSAEEDETTVAPAETTTAAAETTAAAQTTTAQNQATKTGDTAPIALLFVLVAAVAVVTVVAKKKEA